MSNPITEDPDFIKEAEKAYSRGKFQEAVDIASKHFDDADLDNSLDARRMAILAQFQLKDFKTAEKLALYVTERSNAITDWFNLCTSATMNGEFDKGDEAFLKTVNLYTSEKNPPNHIINIYFYYLHALVDMKAYDRALSPLTELKDIYAGFPVTDFTYIIGVAGAIIPSFEDFLDLAGEILKKQKPEIAKEFLNSLFQKTDSEGQESIKRIESNLGL